MKRWILSCTAGLMLMATVLSGCTAQPTTSQPVEEDLVVYEGESSTIGLETMLGQTKDTLEKEKGSGILNFGEDATTAIGIDYAEQEFLGYPCSISYLWNENGFIDRILIHLASSVKREDVSDSIASKLGTATEVQETDELYVAQWKMERFTYVFQQMDGQLAVAILPAQSANTSENLEAAPQHSTAESSAASPGLEE